MPYSALYRYARISPRKLRYMADLVRGKNAVEALEILKYQPNRGARMVEQVMDQLRDFVDTDPIEIEIARNRTNFFGCVVVYD